MSDFIFFAIRATFRLLMLLDVIVVAGFSDDDVVV